MKCLRRILCLVLSLLMLLPMGMQAFAESSEVEVYTSEAGHSAGTYYFDPDGLYETLYEKRCQEQQSEAWAAEQATKDVAAFKAARWYLDPDSLALRAEFASGYDPTAVFDSGDPADASAVLRLVKPAATDQLEWISVAMPESPEDSFNHHEYYFNVNMAYERFMAEAREYYDLHPELVEDKTWAEQEQMIKDRAMYRLEAFRHSLEEDVSSEYFVREDDPLFCARVDALTSEEPIDDDSEFVMEFHDYIDICNWTWIDADTAIAEFKCYLGIKDGENDTVSFTVTGDAIEKRVLREETDLTDGEMECTATVTFPDSLTFLDNTYTDTKIFPIPATGDPERVHFKVQPRSCSVNYPAGATFHVTVDKPELVASYQWEAVDDDGITYIPDGWSAKTDTLIVPSTQRADHPLNITCVVTDINGNKAYSNPARLSVRNPEEYISVLYVGNYAVTPGQTLDLSDTTCGSGTVTFDADGQNMTFDSVHLNASGRPCDVSICNGMGIYFVPGDREYLEYYMHFDGDNVIDNDFIDPEFGLDGTGINAFFASSIKEDPPTLIIDGGGTLTVKGGSNSFYTNGHLELNADIKTLPYAPERYCCSVTADNLYIEKDARLNLTSVGRAICAKGDMYIEDGASIEINMTAQHTSVGDTEVETIIAGGFMHCGKAQINVKGCGIPEMFVPYGRRIAYLNGISCNSSVVLKGTELSITLDAGASDTPYAGDFCGITGEALRGVELSEGAKLDIRIASDAVQNARGIASGSNIPGGIDMADGSSLNIDVRTSGDVIGGDVAKLVTVEDASMNIDLASADGGTVFGILAPEMEIELYESRYAVNINAEDGIAVFLNDDNDAISFDPDYEPELLKISGEAGITVPAGGVVNRYGFQFYGAVVPGESVIDPAKPDEAASRVSIRMNGFVDVKKGAFYYDPVQWAVSQNPQITNGTDATHFSPDATCTRAQVVTFLWRAAGEPEPSVSKNPFADVKAGAYYYKAVLWAVEKGITKGTSETAFSPDLGCTRGQVVTFLHRFENSPAPGNSKNPFTDTKKGAFYYDAVLWAVEKGITKGTSATTFSPDQTCTRAQIVTFLYRAK